jgi:type I site-specific restriction-modification system R (restriction) subunit
MKKTCRSKTCKQINPQPVDNFVSDSRYKDGYQNRCKACQKEYDANRFIQKRDRILKQSKDYYVANLDTARAKRALWREMNRLYAAEYGKKYRKENPGKELAKTRRYMLARKNRLPKWLTKEQIDEMTRIYEKCPKGYEVDHIIPLQGKAISGLHVPYNLQYLPTAENRKKSNKY